MTMVRRTVDRESQDAQVHTQISGERERCRHKWAGSMKQQVGHANAGHASENTQDQSLREQLPDQTAAARAQGGS